MLTAHRFLLLFCILLLSSDLAYAQSSVIDTIQQAKKAVVSIKAQAIDLNKKGHTKPALDPKSGRIVQITQYTSHNLEKSGAGVIVDPEGVIVTNLHTIFGSNFITVILFNGQKLPATILHLVPEHDLAFIKIEPAFSLTAVTIANSDQVRLGQEVLTIGNSYLLDDTISAGKVIGLGKKDTQTNLQTLNDIELLQININIYRGDSGGPLFDPQGRLLGMMVAKQLTVNKSSFAIPSRKIFEHFQQYLSRRRNSS